MLRPLPQDFCQGSHRSIYTILEALCQGSSAVEQWTHKPLVVSSILTPGTKIFNGAGKPHESRSSPARHNEIYIAKRNNHLFRNEIECRRESRP